MTLALSSVARRWGVLVASAVAAAALGFGLGSPAVTEGWLLAFVGLAGLATGALGLLMIGHLLGGYWLDPVRSELEALALTMPLVALLGLPLVPAVEQLYLWAAPGSRSSDLPALRAAWLQRDAFLIRSAVYVAIWCALAFMVARPGEHRALSAAGLSLLVPSATLAAIDWVMSRDPHWWSSLFGFAFSMSQLLPALAGAILIDGLRSPRPERARLRSLEGVLFTLALLTIWTWFIQFLIVWMANLPGEAVWYVRRFQDLGWVMLFVVVPAAVLGAILLMPRRVGGALMVSACLLLLLQHLAHVVWLFHPVLPPGAPTWSAFAVPSGLVALWILWVAAALRTRPNVALLDRGSQ